MASQFSLGQFWEQNPSWQTFLVSSHTFLLVKILHSIRARKGQTSQEKSYKFNFDPCIINICNSFQSKVMIITAFSLEISLHWSHYTSLNYKHTKLNP